MNPYIGHESQICGVEEHRLVGGKGDGMRLFQVRNGLGLEFTVSADRCADISRLSFKGDNFAYMSPCGYVAPQYYDDQGAGFLKSFTAGFLTTCGLAAAGKPCVDEGETLPLHGTISHVPAEHIYSVSDGERIGILAEISDGSLFSRKMAMKRSIVTSKKKNSITITDAITNTGDAKSPLMVLYHFNIGYPLLDENALLRIPSKKVTPRNDHAAAGIAQWDVMTFPEEGCRERCYYHTFDEKGLAAIFNPGLNAGLAIRYDAAALKYFTEWKMMGVRDYVLGLEPGNCHPDGRDVMRKQGALTFIAPDETITYEVTIDIIESHEQWDAI